MAPDAPSDFAALALAELDQVIDPCSVGAGNPMSLVEMGLIDSVALDPAGRCLVRMRLTAPGCLMVGVFREECLARLGALPGVVEVDVEFDAGLDWSPEMLTPEASSRRNLHLIQRGQFG